MKHCPSPACPYRRRHRRAQEYLDSAVTCSDCGTELAAGEAPEAESAADAARPSASSWKRLAVTVAAAVGALAAGRIGLPGLDTGRLLAHGHQPPQTFGLLSLGLMPFITTSIVVELACLIVPPWRLLRVGGLDGRARIWRAVLVLALLLSIAQALGISLTLQSLDLALHPGVAFHVLTIATLVAGAFVLLALAHAIDRFGLGNGFSVLIAAGIAHDLGGTVRSIATRVQSGLLGPVHVLIVGAAALVVVAATVRASRLLGTGAATAPTSTLRVPACGAIPVTEASGLFALSATLANLGIPGFDKAATTFHAGAALNVLASVALALALVTLLSYLFHRPSRVADLVARLRGPSCSIERERQRARGLLRRAMIRSSLYVLALIACEFVAGSASSFGVALDAVGIAVLTAVALDLLVEWRARGDTDDLAAIWPEHRVYAVDVALEALEQAQIPVFVRGVHHRVLLQFFGPFVPMQLFVPRDKAAQAQALVRELIGPAQTRSPTSPAPAALGDGTS